MGTPVKIINPVSDKRLAQFTAGVDTVPVEFGGTGAGLASAALSNLGGQPLDSNLTNTTAPFTTGLNTKLSGIDDEANNYAPTFGTAAGETCEGNDARLSDARTPTAHDHDAAAVTSGVFNIARVPDMGAASAGTGGAKGVVPAALAGKQDAILHGDATWRAGYVHPNHTGDVTSSADGAQTIVNKQTMTGSGGVTVSNTPTVIASAAPDISLNYGSTANTVCQGNDARLSDARTPTAHDHDAAAVTSGVFDIGRIPATAIERMSIVADEAARFALTTASVQNGDSVKQTDTGAMYVVVDSMNLANASGYEEYTAGSAAAVPWTGVTGKPTAFTPDTHTHASTDITDFGTDVAATSAVSANTAKETNATHTGDVTGSVELTIGANKVTTGKMQHVATASILGRNTGGTGDIEVMTAANARNVLNVANGATANDTDANLKSRANHTGTEPVTAGGTGLTAIADKTMLVANAANTLTALVVPAGKSIRRNAVDTAFETFTPGGGGTVTSVSVATANGFAGTVATATTTPAITLTTSVTGILKGNGTLISAATVTGSGNVVLATSPTLTTPNIGAATGTSLSLTSDLAVDTDTFFVDQSTGFVGIGTETPDAPIHYAAETSLEVSSPTMIDNTDPSPYTISSAPPAEGAAHDVFDGSLTTHLCMNSGLTTGNYVSLDYGPGASKENTQYRIYVKSTDNSTLPTGWKIIGSNVASPATPDPLHGDWTTLHTITGQSLTLNQWSSNYVMTSTGGYRHYAIFFTSGQSARYTQFTEMEYFAIHGSDTRVNATGIGVGVAEASIAAQVHISGSTAFKASGTLWANPSDARLKDVAGLADLAQCWSDVSDIPTKRYAVKTDCFTQRNVPDRNQTGWVAQDVQAVIPKAVSEVPFTKLDGTVITDCLHLDQSQLFPTLFGAFQLAQQRIVTLEGQVADLLARVTALEV